MKLIARNKNHFELFSKIIRKFVEGKLFLTEQYFKSPSIFGGIEEEVDVKISYYILQSKRMIQFNIENKEYYWKMEDFKAYTIKQIYDYMYENTTQR